MTTDNQNRLALMMGLYFCAVLFALALFQSSSLVTLSYDLEPGPTSEKIIVACETWHGWMQTIGTAGITEYLTDQVSTLHETTID